MALPTDADPLDEEPEGDDPRHHDHDPDLPEADSLEQELAVGDEIAELRPDAEREEPLDDGYDYGE